MNSRTLAGILYWALRFARSWPVMVEADLSGDFPLSLGGEPAATKRPMMGACPAARRCDRGTRSSKEVEEDRGSEGVEGMAGPAGYCYQLLFFSGSDYQSLLLPVLISVVVILALQLLCRPSWMRKKRNSKCCGGGGKGMLPPGSVGLPLIGETLRLIAAYKTEDPEPFIDERVRRHGRLFTTHVFGERTVFSADPEFMLR